MRLARSAGKNSPKVGLSRIKSNPQIKSVQQDFESESHALLTVTILEANLKVDLSSFLQKMQTYCSIKLTKQIPSETARSKRSVTEIGEVDYDSMLIVQKRTQNSVGKAPKWSESFAFQLGAMCDSTLENELE